MDAIDTADLSFEVRARLAELGIELSEGDITEKGYQKKKSLLLAPFLANQAAAPKIEDSSRGQGLPCSAVPLLGLCGHDSGSASQLQHQNSASSAGSDLNQIDLSLRDLPDELVARRGPGRRYDREDIRYRSDTDGSDTERTAPNSTKVYATGILADATKPPRLNWSSVAPQPRGLTGCGSGDSRRERYPTSASITSDVGPGNPFIPGHAPVIPVATALAAASAENLHGNAWAPRRGHFPPVTNIRSVTDCPRFVTHLGNAVNSSASSSMPCRVDSFEEIAAAAEAQLGLPDSRAAIPTTAPISQIQTFQASPSISEALQRHQHPVSAEQCSQLTSAQSNNPQPDGLHTHVYSNDQQFDVDVHNVGLASQPSGSQAEAPSASTSGLVCQSRVSEKIMQLVNTLKRPKRRPLPEYFLDEDDQVLIQPVVDPSAPQPRGVSTEPLAGEDLVIPSGLPRNLESALQRFAGLIGKTSAVTCVTASGKSAQVITYSKLLQRSSRIAYMLLNKLGHRGEQSLKPRDRVGLVYSSSEPISFLTAFYGCLLASVVPIAIEVPSTRRDAACQSMGFLLSSQDARVVLASEQCYKLLQRGPSGDISNYPGWPRVTWINTDHHSGGSKPPKDWTPPDRLMSEETMYIEYTYAKDGSVRGVMVSRMSILAHCRALTAACHYSEGDIMICVVDCRREAGLWHAALASVFNGIHVIFVPYTVLQLDPGCWIRMVTKYRATVAVVKSRDLHWALLSERDHPYVNLSSLRVLLVVDGANPWSLNSCDPFVRKFRAHGLAPEALCPAAGSPETLTLCLRRPLANHLSTPLHVLTNGSSYQTSGSASSRGSSSAAASARGVISIHGLSYGVVRVDTEDSLTSLILQDCGQVLPGATAVVVRLGSKPVICRTDEVGEICLAADYTGYGYWGLDGQTGSHFRVEPIAEDGQSSPVAGRPFVRSGFIGFPGPVSSGGLIFICGSVDGILNVADRRHNADDIVATVLAVQPTRIVYRGRIAVFAIEMLKDERITVVAELRQGFSDESAFAWMSQVLQAVDSIHQANLYSIALVPQNYLPKTPFGGIHIQEVRRLFSIGQLHPAVLLLCPHSAIQNLPQPRQTRPSLIGPSAVMVGQVIQGARLAEAHGRTISASTTNLTAVGPSTCDTGVLRLPDILVWRALHTPEDCLFTVYNQKGQVSSSLTCMQLHRRAERLASLVQEKGKAGPGSVVALIYPPGTEMVCAFYACLYIGAIPVLVRPPRNESLFLGSNSSSGVGSPFSGSTSDLSSGLVFSSAVSGGQSYTNFRPSSRFCLENSLETTWQIVIASRAVACLTQSSVIKLIRSRDAISRINLTKWPQLIDSEENWRKKLANVYQPPDPDQAVAYLDFTVATTGTLTGVQVTHFALNAMCKAQKMQCEFYPAREVVLSLEPYSGLAASLWVLSSIYCGHHSILVPPSATEAVPELWLTLCSQRKVRDAFCSYPTLELSAKYITDLLPTLKQRDVSLDSLRSLVVVAEERPRVTLTSNFTKLFSALNLSPRVVSTSFGCRTNLAICLQGASSPDITTVYADRISLRNDRVKLLEKGSPHSVCLMESGKLLPGVQVAIANPDTFGQCADSHLGEIWVSSLHNSSALLGPFPCSSLTRPSTALDLQVNDSFGDQFSATTNQNDCLYARLATGDTERVYARTGFLGFVRRTQLTQSDGELHDAVFVVGKLEETMVLRGMRFYPADIENTVFRSHKKISECAVFTWSNLLVVVVELSGEENEALDLVHPVTARVLDEHQLIVGVVVVTDPGTVPIDLRGQKQRILLRDNFVTDKLDPIYVSYNM